jgi:enoyl-CoA hydratase/carnithine racemase
VIDYQVHEAIAVITLDNGRLNILSRALHERLYRTLLRFLRDDQLKVAVLTCKPGTSFSAGDDLKEIDLPFGDEPDWAELTMTLLRNKPIVAATRGHCIGQGLIYLLLLTDIRFAAADARFGFPEISKGMGGAAHVSRLATQIPLTVARRMALTGDTLNAEQAAACHLVNEVVPDAELLERALTEARKIAAHPLPAIKAEMSPAGRLGGRENPWDALALLNELWPLQRR